MKLQIAIDGPSGAGKSSVAKALAAILGIVYVDTGALYRAVGLYAKQRGADPHNADQVSAILPDLSLSIRYENGKQEVYLNGEATGDRIRTPEMSMYASAVSAIPAVRSFLLDTQREIAEQTGVVMDGRDIGTVILPQANVKIFLTASGGPFYGYSSDRLREITVERALAHPTWKMGAKITIDCATMVNKSFEIIEAHYLFN